MISKLNLTGLSAGFGASPITNWKVRKGKEALVGQDLPAGGQDPKPFCRYPKAEAVNLMAKSTALWGKWFLLFSFFFFNLHIKVSSAVQIPANVTVLLEKCLPNAGTPPTLPSPPPPLLLGQNRT